MTLVDQKKALRTALTETRKAAFEAVDPGPALASLRVVLAEKPGRVSFYWPIRTEIDPRPVLQDLAGTRPLCLPVTEGRAALRFLAWTPDTPLVADGFGVPVPAEGEDVSPDVLVVPLLGFDRNLQRLGYGAGHYDRTLQVLRAVKTVTAIGFAFAAQEIDVVPTERTDQPLDLIITEQGVHRHP